MFCPFKGSLFTFILLSFQVLVVFSSDSGITYVSSGPIDFSRSALNDGVQLVRFKRSSSNITANVTSPTNTSLDVTTRNPVTNVNLSSVTTQNPNLTVTNVQDDHIYYKRTNSRMFERYWVDIDQLPTKQIHPNLSNDHLRAVSVHLPFEFLYYGHTIKNLTIATGGFLYMSDFLHQWIAATQYVAPLMANFDTRSDNRSLVSYGNNETVFVVQWENVKVHQQETLGYFNFQVVLKKGGEIFFVYKSIPVSLGAIDSSEHHVRVGLADAFYVDQTFHFLRRRTIHEYHKISIQLDEIHEKTVIRFTPVPTCNTLYNCTSCLTAKINFKCGWCPEVRKCSDGLDRERQKWFSHSCQNSKLNSTQCSSLPHHQRNTEAPPVLGPGGTGSQSQAQQAQTVGIVIGVIILLAIVLGVIGWLAYAFYNPHTPSGLFLIENRPTRLKQKFSDTLSHVKFWKKSDVTGERYQVSMPSAGSTVA